MVKSQTQRQRAAIESNDEQLPELDIQELTAQGKFYPQSELDSDKDELDSLAGYDSDERVEIETERMDIAALKNSLFAHNIYFDRRTELPKALAALFASVTLSREGPPSPKSKEVSQVSRFTSKMSELDAMIYLENYFGFPPTHTLGGGGDENICRTHSQLWTASSIPTPNSLTDNLAAILDAVGSPPRPKPDITYGYTRSTFSNLEFTKLASLPSSTTGTRGAEPLFPFLIFEWKSGLGMAETAELQAMRDGAAAVNTHRHFFVETGIAQPSESDTAMFCVYVGPRNIDIYLSWRREHPRDGISWEMDKVFAGLLERPEDVFFARTILLNIRNWALQQRLKRIKAALRSFKKRKAEDDSVGEERQGRPKRRRG
ncbi:MAG: hypothetical protein M1834_005495 [Cirrosporium novae-zelandiae]|nr:MAG: hypothetical protein M1834_005495 [Cirrosporium novae-zelandiae]